MGLVEGKSQPLIRLKSSLPAQENYLKHTQAAGKEQEVEEWKRMGHPVGIDVNAAMGNTPFFAIFGFNFYFVMLYF